MTFTVKARVRVYGKRGNSVKTFTHKSDAKNHRDALQEALGHYPEGYPKFYEVLSVRIEEAKARKP